MKDLNNKGVKKMKNNEETISALNQLLQGENMAVDTFNIFISKLNDEKAKKVFQKVQNQHRENMNTLANYIQNIDGEPKEKLGLKGVMADMKLKVEIDDPTHTSDIIKKAIDGETFGINMAEKVLRGNLDDNSREVAGDILHKDRASLDRLNSLIDESRLH